ncbi:hypothetical protein chiPu_0014500 [Chiloscyllium punctatum]|uniref:PPM-type phosphatase domain-containing protein n=1 Tax=Chiloscyllium punctatum TaxID=137246 RepID=A0A401T028_CHIPU|nr:hypothetical protein [Chiloscyllium punctatum]
MMTRVKAVVSQLVGGQAAAGSSPQLGYSRPVFLQLSPEEREQAADHNRRNVISPGSESARRRLLLPWDTGYAEVINAGKSVFNEDQASREIVWVERRNPNSSTAGEVVKGDRSTDKDQQIEREQKAHGSQGGCCALAVVYLLGKIYIANAGDSRAILIRNGEIIPLSHEFTPESERQRLQYLGYLQPHLLGNEFTHLEFPRRIQHRELGRRMLFRDYSMTGW